MDPWQQDTIHVLTSFTAGWFHCNPRCLTPTFRPHKSIVSLNAEILCNLFWRLWLLNLTYAVYAVTYNRILVIRQALLSLLIFSSSFCTHRNICTPKLSWRWFPAALEEGKERGRGREQDKWRLIIPKLDMLLLGFFHSSYIFVWMGSREAPFLVALVVVCVLVHKFRSSMEPLYCIPGKNV